MTTTVADLVTYAVEKQVEHLNAVGHSPENDRAMVARMQDLRFRFRLAPLLAHRPAAVAVLDVSTEGPER